MLKINITKEMIENQDQKDSLKIVTDFIRKIPKVKLVHTANHPSPCGGIIVRVGKIKTLYAIPRKLELWCRKKVLDPSSFKLKAVRSWKVNNEKISN